MKTFKQFLEEVDALDDLVARLFVGKFMKIKGAELEQVVSWMMTGSAVANDAWYKITKFVHAKGITVLQMAKRIDGGGRSANELYLEALKEIAKDKYGIEL